MSIDIRLPNITGQTEREQLAQIKSYLYQTAQQLQWALSKLDTATGNVVTVNTGKTNSQETGGTAQSPVASFNAIKALIIKSADVVDAYYEEINRRLSGLYVAESDFGTYTEQTDQAITENSTEIERAFTNIQQIITDIDTLEYSLIEVHAHIRQGLLYTREDGVPVYGLEIGQRNELDGVEVFNKYARFTSDRLSFYDSNDTEVAYISDYKLHITNAEITGALTLGAFQINTTSGFRLKYVGRS